MNERTSYHRVRPSRLYEQVAQQIRSRIMARELEPGDKLPSESELGEEFGVSRTVVREALKTLEIQQLVEVRHGSGAFICEPTPEPIADALSTLSNFRGASVFDLHHVREILEVEVAGLAAENASVEQRRQLRDLVAQMEQNGDDLNEYVHLDLLFHMKLAEATGNGVFLLLIEPLVDLMVQSRLRAIQVPGGLEDSLEGHRAICECVQAGDAQRARAAMRKHLEDTGNRLVCVDETGFPTDI